MIVVYDANSNEIWFVIVAKMDALCIVQESSLFDEYMRLSSSKQSVVEFVSYFRQ